MTDTDKSESPRYNQTTLRGVVRHVTPAQTRGKSSYEFRVLRLALDGNPKYPQYAEAEAGGRDMALLDGVGVGDLVEADCWVNGREWNDKCFVTLKLRAVRDVSGRAGNADAFDAAPELPDRNDAPQGRAVNASVRPETALINAEFDAATEGGSDELPF